MIRPSSTILGISCSIGLPLPNMKMTMERPPRSSRAVPTISEKNSRQGISQAFSSFFMRSHATFISNTWYPHAGRSR